MSDLKVITLDGIEYIRKDSIQKESKEFKDLNYVIVRGDRSGVFAGELCSKKDREVELKNCRRLWYWDGASSLSELAEKGTSKPNDCKFPVEMRLVRILDAIEIIVVSETAYKSIKSVANWSQHDE